MMIFFGVIAVIAAIGVWACERVDAPRRRAEREAARAATLEAAAQPAE